MKYKSYVPKDFPNNLHHTPKIPKTSSRIDNDKIEDLKLELEKYKFQLNRMSNFDPLLIFSYLDNYTDEVVSY